MTTGERFWSKVDMSGDCWLWTGARNVKGYGMFNLDTKTSIPRLAHRVAWEAVNGPVPDGLQLDHLCRVPTCVRPSHLEPVTNAENHRRAALARLTCRRGHPWSTDNTYRTSNGYRTCRACVRLRVVARREVAA